MKSLRQAERSAFSCALVGRGAGSPTCSVLRRCGWSLRRCRRGLRRCRRGLRLCSCILRRCRCILRRRRRRLRRCSRARAAPPAGTAPPPTALTAVRQPADSEAAFRCRQANAAEPLGLTREQYDMKSLRQAERSAFSCALVGRGAAAPTCSGGRWQRVQQAAEQRAPGQSHRRLRSLPFGSQPTARRHSAADRPMPQGRWA